MLYTNIINEVNQSICAHYETSHFTRDEALARLSANTRPNLAEEILAKPLDDDAFRHTSTGRKLWCVHVHASDDLIPMPSRDLADRQAAKFNAWWAKHLADHNTDGSYGDPSLTVVEAIEWPYTADEHAKALAELRADDPDGWLNPASASHGGQS